jgi:AbrB family looped-hinge helix DNA binding protein
MNTGSAYHDEVTTMTRKGQISVPAAIRSALGLKEGDKVAFSLAGGKKKQATLRPVQSVADMTSGKLASPVPMRSPEEERAAFAEGVADELAEETK